MCIRWTLDLHAKFVDVVSQLGERSKSLIISVGSKVLM